MSPAAKPPVRQKNGLLAKGEKLAPLAERLARLGLVRDWDFVLHLPLRYEDLTSITPIGDLREGMTAQVQGTVLASHTSMGGRFQQLIATVSDDTGKLQVRLLHFFPNQQALFKKGCRIRLFGEVRVGFDFVIEMVHPKISKALEEGDKLPSTLTPVYPAGESITQTWLRKRIDRALLDVDITDPVPAKFLEKNGYPSLVSALKSLHHPEPGADREAMCNRTTPAWQRLKFDELLAQQVTLQGSRALKALRKAAALTGTVAGAPAGFYERLTASLPFALTGAQSRVVGEIAADMARTTPMNRLVQGDVGCGKTIVAALSAARCVDSGFQAALMAPTEILAEQHYKKLSELLTPLGMRVGWLAGSLTPSKKAQTQADINEGKYDFVIGTHALIQDAVKFPNLGLAIVDEQHRFGVNQRLHLRSGKDTDNNDSEWPHLLMLSATPIPRTLAMSYLADIDVSVIDELPPGRTPVTTSVMSLGKLDEVIAGIDRVIEGGHQCYWVCPLIEESEVSDLSAATVRAQYLAQMLPERRVALIHGAMSAAEKQSVMESFARGETDVLTATTVIEVGVDVANATVMVIEHSERFGLAQLHQLRGRVGRGADKSHCVLLYDPEIGQVGTKRLNILRNTTDGFEIARQDLAIRGPGEFLGARQSGLPLLRFADPATEGSLLDDARNAAAQWIIDDPMAARAHATRWYAGKEAELLQA